MFNRRRLPPRLSAEPPSPSPQSPSAMDRTRKKHHLQSSSVALSPQLCTNSLCSIHSHVISSPAHVSDCPCTDTHLQMKAMTLSADSGSCRTKSSSSLLSRQQQCIAINAATADVKRVGKRGHSNANGAHKLCIGKPSGGRGDGLMKSVMVDSGPKSLRCSDMEVGFLSSSLGAKIVAQDMPPLMQIRAVTCARRTHDSLEKFSAKALAFALKKEFDGAYGPAWHCIVGTSFGSFVTYSVGRFLYLSMDKLYILLFQTTVQKND